MAEQFRLVKYDNLPRNGDHNLQGGAPATIAKLVYNNSNFTVVFVGDISN